MTNWCIQHPWMTLIIVWGVIEATENILVTRFRSKMCKHCREKEEKKNEKADI